MEDRLVDAVAHGFDVSIRLRNTLEDYTLIAHMLGGDTAQRVQTDRMQAMQLGIRSIPTLIISSADKTTDPIRLQTTPAKPARILMR